MKIAAAAERSAAVSASTGTIAGNGIIVRRRLLKKAHLLRWRPWPHAQRTGSTPRVRPAGAASHLDLFDGGPRHGPPYPPTLGAPRRSRGAPRPKTGSSPGFFINAHTVVVR